MKRETFCKGLLAAIALAGALGLTACGSSSESTSTSTGYMASADTGSVTTEAAYAEEWMESESSTVTAEEVSDYYESRKLIRTVDMSVETQEFDALLANVQAQVEALGGYIENLYTYNGSSYYDYAYSSRSASVMARVPSASLDDFLNQVAEEGNVISRSESVEDVTLTYVDLESRRDALETEQERLLELLEQAETVEDIVTIEDKLSDVRYELQSMESQIRTYDNQIDFATVYLDIAEVVEYTPTQEETVWERLSNGFVDSLEDVGDGLVEFFIWFVTHIPQLVVWAAVIAVIVLIVRLIVRRRRARREQKQANKTAQQAPVQEFDTKGNNDAGSNEQQ